MRRFAFLALFLSALASAAPLSLKEVVAKQGAAVAARYPGATLFEVKAWLHLKDLPETLRQVESHYSLPNNDFNYLLVDFDLQVAPLPYLPTVGRGGAHPVGPGVRRPRPRPESPDLHPALTGWQVDLEKIAETATLTGHEFTTPAQLEVTTVGRLRGRSIAYSRALAGLRDSRAVVVVIDQVPAEKQGMYLVLDAATGEELARGTFTAPKPPPPIPGNVSSGG